MPHHKDKETLLSRLRQAAQDEEGSENESLHIIDSQDNIETNVEELPDLSFLIDFIYHELEIQNPTDDDLVHSHNQEIYNLTQQLVAIITTEQQQQTELMVQFGIYKPTILRQRLWEILEVITVKKHLIHARQLIALSVESYRAAEYFHRLQTTIDSGTLDIDHFLDILLYFFSPAARITISNTRLPDLYTTTSTLTNRFEYLFYASFKDVDLTLRQNVIDFVIEQNPTMNSFPRHSLAGFDILQAGLQELITLPIEDIKHETESRKLVTSARAKEVYRHSLTLKKHIESHITQFYTCLITPTHPEFNTFASTIRSLLMTDNEEVRSHLFAVLGLSSIAQLYEAYRQVQLLRNNGEELDFYELILENIRLQLEDMSDTAIMTLSDWALIDKAEYYNTQIDWQTFRDLLNTFRSHTSENSFLLSNKDIQEIPWTYYQVVNPEYCSVLINGKIVTLTLQFDPDAEIIFTITLDLHKGKEVLDWSLLDTTELQHAQPYKQACLHLAHHILDKVRDQTKAIKAQKIQSQLDRFKTVIGSSVKKISGDHIPDPMYALRKTAAKSQISKHTPLPEKRVEEDSSVHGYSYIRTDNIEDFIWKFPKKEANIIKKTIAVFNSAQRQPHQTKLKKLAITHEITYRLKSGAYRIILKPYSNNELEIVRIARRPNAYVNLH